MDQAGQKDKMNETSPAEELTPDKVIGRVVGRGRNLSKLIPREEILT